MTERTEHALAHAKQYRTCAGSTVSEGQPMMGPTRRMFMMGKKLFTVLILVLVTRTVTAQTVTPLQRLLQSTQEANQRMQQRVHGQQPQQQQQPTIDSKQTDWTCMQQCQAKGSQWGYCESICTY